MITLEDLIIPLALLAGLGIGYPLTRWLRMRAWRRQMNDIARARVRAYRVQS